MVQPGHWTLKKTSPGDSNVQPGVRITDLEEVFQAEGTANARALRQEQAWRVFEE